MPLRGGGCGGDVNVFHSFATDPGAPGLARRMVERSVRFIHIYHASRDYHSNLNEELSFNCEMADQPVAALIKDLKQRGLLDPGAPGLVLWLSEFGRTPLGENPGAPGLRPKSPAATITPSPSPSGAPAAA